jgi:hypothetical protein
VKIVVQDFVVCNCCMTVFNVCNDSVCVQIQLAYVRIRFLYDGLCADTVLV